MVYGDKVMKEYLIIKGAEQCDNQYMRVLLVQSVQAKTNIKIGGDYTELAHKMMQNLTPLVFIVFIPVFEWRDRKYNIGSSIWLEIGG